MGFAADCGKGKARRKGAAPHVAGTALSRAPSARGERRCPAERPAVPFSPRRQPRTRSQPRAEPRPVPRRREATHLHEVEAGQEGDAVLGHFALRPLLGGHAGGRCGRPRGSAPRPLAAARRGLLRPPPPARPRAGLTSGAAGARPLNCFAAGSAGGREGGEAPFRARGALAAAGGRAADGRWGTETPARDPGGRGDARG